MSNMGKTVVRRIGAVDVVCRELTVAGLRGLLGRQMSGSLLDDLLFEELRLSDLQELTNLSADQVSEMRPSDLREVISGCKEANPDFFALLARLASPSNPS